MDNNKRVELNKIEYENMYTVREINKVSMSESGEDAKIASQFNDAMKNAKNSLKKKKSKINTELNDDIVVDSSLKELINQDNKIQKTIKEKIAESKKIKELLSEDKIAPSKTSTTK